MSNRKNDIERYLRGELSPAEMHALEKAALNDPFLAEALEGIDHAGADNFLDDLHSLNRKVHERTRQRKSRTVKMLGWTAGLAATVLLIAVSGFLVITLLREQTARQQAMQEEALLLEDSTDTLYVVFPAEAIAQATKINHPGTNTEGTSRRESTRKLKSNDPAGAETIIAQDESQEVAESVIAARDEFQETPDDRAGSVEPEAEQEPIALADIPEERPATGKAREADNSISKKLEGRAAGVQSRQATPAVTRSLSDNVMLLKGKVTSAADGEGIPGVNIVLKGTNVQTATDFQGNYQIPVHAEKSTLSFSFIGYVSEEVTINDTDALNVTLEEDVSALSEVVIVSGYGVANDSASEPATFAPAAPQGGRNSFKDYLNGAVVYPQQALTNKIEGRVTVRFTVQPNGQLTDFDIVKGIGHGCDEELLRAIKTGPRWEPASRGSTPLADKVKVRYRFELP